MTEAILYLKRKPTIAKKMGKNGRKYVEENVSIRSMGLQMKEILAAVLQRTTNKAIAKRHLGMSL